MKLVSAMYGLFAYLTTTIETPVYESLGTFNPSGQVSFEVRDYVPSVAAQTCSDSTNSEFMTLAGYIGVMSGAQNSRSEKIAMTAPVVDYQNEDGERCMQFILPESEFGGDVSSAPTPTNDKVKLVGRPEMIMAAITFSGRPSEKDFADKIDELKLALQAMEGDDSFQWAVKEPAHAEEYQYNEPWIPGPWRTNEVVIELQSKN